MINPKILFFAIAYGLLPVIFWLWFWLKEDNVRPEPKGLILLAFFGGMISVLVVLPLERYISEMMGVSLEQYIDQINLTIIITILFWVIIEEVVKFITAYFFVLNKKDCDEPIDVIIYLITTALGFAAIENIFFLFQPLLSENIIDFIAVGNYRFMGPTMLHVISSGTIGLFWAFAFYQTKLVKFLYIGWGLILAIALHTLFNLFIIQDKDIYLVFSVVWVCVIFFIIFIEKIKKITKIKI